MERVFEKSVVDARVSVKVGREGGEGGRGKFDHFVFAVVDGAGAAVFLTIGHGVADRETAHKRANAGIVPAEVFGEQEVKVVGEEEKGVERDGEMALMLAYTLFGGERFGGETRNPRQGSAIGKAKVVGEGEEESLVVGLVRKKEGVGFGGVTEVVGVTGFKVAQE